MPNAKLILLVGLFLAAGCVRRSVAPDGGVTLDPDAGAPFTILGVDPPHGPFNGGTRAVIEGAGVRPGATVAVDGVLLEDVTVRSAGRIAVWMPPHAPGAVSVTVSDPDGRSTTRERAFSYDALVVEPTRGPSLGGTRVEIESVGSVFEAGDVFTFGGAPCTEVAFLAPERIQCRTPSAESSGLVAVRVLRDDVELLAVPDAFEYEATTSTGGEVGGGAIDGEIRVRAVSFRGEVPDAVVQVVTATHILEQRTGSDGWTTFSESGLTGPVTVHVGHPCYGITSVVDIDARSLVLPLGLGPTGPTCPTPPPSSGSPAMHLTGTVRGLAQFPAPEEFAEPSEIWTGVPLAGPGEVQVLYVGIDDPAYHRLAYQRFFAADYDPGERGFLFEHSAEAGGMRVRAVAGLEPVGASVPFHEVPAEHFRPYVIGESAAIFVPPDGESERAAVLLDIPLDGRVSVDARGTEGEVSVDSYPTYGIFFRESLHADTLPAALAFGRVPRQPAFWGRNTIFFNFALGDSTRAGVWMDAYLESFAVEALAELVVVEPVTRGGWGGRVVVETEAPLDVLQIRLLGPRPWFILARGTVREVRSIVSEDPAFHMLPGDYQLLVDGGVDPSLDFDDVEVSLTQDSLSAATTEREGALTVVRSVSVRVSPVLVR